MKKLLALLTALFLCLSFAACGNSETLAPGTRTYRFFVPDGAPALAVANFIAPTSQLTEFSMHVVNASSIAAHASTDADFAIMPVNAASKLFANNDAMKMVAVVTHGNLFIVGNGEASALTDLYGKTLGVIQRGNVPDLTLKAILEEKGIAYEESETPIEGKIALRYYNVATDMLPALKKGMLDFGVLPEPAVTNSALPVRFSLQSLYGENDYPQAVLMVKKEVLDELSERYVADLLTALSDSIAWVKEDVEGRPAAAVEKLSAYLEEGLESSLDGSKLTHTSILNCNLSVQKSADAKEVVKAYLAKIKAIEPTAVGDVTDAFFY